MQAEGYPDEFIRLSLTVKKKSLTDGTEWDKIGEVS